LRTAWSYTESRLIRSIIRRRLQRSKSKSCCAPLVKVCGKPSILLGFQLSTNCARLHYADVYCTLRMGWPTHTQLTGIEPTTTYSLRTDGAGKTADKMPSSCDQRWTQRLMNFAAETARLRDSETIWQLLFILTVDNILGLDIVPQTSYLFFNNNKNSNA